MPKTATTTTRRRALADTRTTRAKRGPLRRFWYDEVEKNKPRWTYLLAPIGSLVTIVSIVAVLWTSERTYRADRATETLERAETAFQSVQTRLSDRTANTRAVAVIQLAELAQQPLPRDGGAEFVQVRDKRRLTPLPRDGGAETSRNSDEPPFSRAAYPYLPRAVRQFTTLLALESDAGVRRALVQEVGTLVAFLQTCRAEGRDTMARAMFSVPSPSIPFIMPSRVEKPVLFPVFETEAMQIELVNLLADANRAARDAFVRAWANFDASGRWRNKKTGARMFDIPVTATGFCGTSNNGRKNTRTVLEYFTKQPLFATPRAIQAARLLSLDKPDRARAEIALLPELERAARALVDTRDALATALRGLPEPVGFPTKAEMEAATKTLLAALERWQKRSPSRPALHEVFLADANLEGAQLVGANLLAAQLAGANLRRTQLAGANLRRTQLLDVDLRKANLSGADLLAADLSGAKLYGTLLSGANLYGVYTDDEAYLSNIRQEHKLRFDAPDGFDDVDAGDARTLALCRRLKIAPPAKIVARVKEQADAARGTK